MIEVSSLKGKKFSINARGIEFMEARPDTTIFLLSGNSVVVQESVDEVIEKVIQYRKGMGISPSRGIKYIYYPKR